MFTVAGAGKGDGKFYGDATNPGGTPGAVESRFPAAPRPGGPLPVAAGLGLNEWGFDCG